MWQDNQILKMKAVKFEKVSLPKGITSPGIKDSDKDGVIDSIDCKPFDKNKQGWIHNLAEKIVQRKREKEESDVQERSIRKEAKEVEDDTYFQERKKHLIGQAKKKAAARASRGTFSERTISLLDKVSAPPKRSMSVKQYKSKRSIPLKKYRARPQQRRQATQQQKKKPFDINNVLKGVNFG